MKKQDASGGLWTLGRRGSLSRSLFTIIICLFILPSLLLGVVFQIRAYLVVEEDYETIALDLVSRVSNQLHYRMLLYETMLEGVSRNEVLNQRLAASYDTMLSRWETTRYVEQSFSYIYDELPGIVDFRIYHTNESLVEDGGVLWKPAGRPLGAETDAQWFARATSLRFTDWQVQLGARGPEAILSAAIGTSSQRVNGAVYLRMSLQRVFGDELAATPYSGSQYAIADAAGRVILATDPALIGLAIGDTAYDAFPYDGSGAASKAEGSFVRAFSAINDGWVLYGQVPFSDLRRNTLVTSLWQGLCVGAVLLIGLGTILLIVRNYSVRLRRLDRRMRTLSHGEMNVSLPVNASDELGAVEERFNRMARHIQELMRQLEEQKQRELEEAIRTIESYVNPHFLYNTLGLIRWRALDDGDQVLCDLVDDMTTYYRLSLSGGRSVVTIGDEVSHLEAYIAIQQRRYDDSVAIGWNVDDRALEAFTPKNILQTIVENSYVHGLIPEREGNRISIAVTTDERRVRFEIADNGVGIPAEKLARILDEDAETGVGIRSVRQRLRMYFGDDMRMDIQSEGGTRVFIEIPYCLTEPKPLRGA